LVWIFCGEENKPEPVTNLLWRYDMANATVKLTWVKSVSTNVLKQVLTVKKGEETAVDTELAPDVQEALVVDVSENVLVTASVVVENTWGVKSVPATVTFTLTDIVPAPVTDLTYTVVEVK
jgi:hypothetical protein